MVTLVIHQILDHTNYCYLDFYFEVFFLLRPQTNILKKSNSVHEMQPLEVITIGRLNIEVSVIGT